MKSEVNGSGSSSNGQYGVGCCGFGGFFFLFCGGGFFPFYLLTISAQTRLTRLVKFINTSRWGEDLVYQ